MVIGGFQEGKPFLGMVGMLGVHFTDEHIATGASMLWAGSSTGCSPACAARWGCGFFSFLDCPGMQQTMGQICRVVSR